MRVIAGTVAWATLYLAVWALKKNVYFWE